MLKKIANFFKEIKEQRKRTYRYYAHNAIVDAGFWAGRLISSSKSGYRDRYPDHLVIFNSNIFTKRGGKVWFGDIDYTFDCKQLKKVANKIKEPLYILREMDGRFDNENLPHKQVVEKAVVIIEPDE